MRGFLSGQECLIVSQKITCINTYFKAVTLFLNNQVLDDRLSSLQVSLLNKTGIPKEKYIDACHLYMRN